jgi:glycosyltransferase involved in cell wall biosynthesis/D-alanine-D-alanine ligase-like ATP-grasp enzyme
MTRLWTHPLTLRALYATAMGRAFLRWRNPRRRETDRHRVRFYETKWREAAEELGATFSPVGNGIFEIALGDTRTRVVENTCAIDDPVTLSVLSDKALTHRILSAQSVPVPRHLPFSFANVAKAIDFLRSTPRDCVVKPAAGTGGGRGVTTGVRTPAQLAAAAAAAAVYTDDLLIEEQVAGDNYRLLYLDGQLIDAFVRRPPTVTGDGRSTVAALLRRANDQRHRSGAGVSQVLLTVDPDMRRTLAQQNLTLRSVPPAGKTVTLKTVVNENAGADNTTATHLLCDAIVEDCARAVRALRVRLAGVDVITPDPAVPLSAAGGVVLEVNAPPNFYYHYHKRDGVFPVARHVLPKLLLDRSASDLESWRTGCAPSRRRALPFPSAGEASGSGDCPRAGRGEGEREVSDCVTSQLDSQHSPSPQPSPAEGRGRKMTPRQPAQRIRIAHVINSFEHGGAETMLCNLLLRADRDRFEPHVVALIDDLTVAGPVIDAGIPLATMDMRPGVPSPAGVARLARHLRRLRPDVVHCWMDHSNLLGGVAARLAGAGRVVWAVHHSHHVPGVAKRSTRLTVAACARLSRVLPDRIVYCSEHARRLYEQSGFAAHQSATIPNGFDLDTFKPDPAARRAIRAELGVADDVPLVGLVARYDPFKDHPTFLRAAALLAQKRPDVRLLLCGHRVDRNNAALVAGIASLGLSDRCHLLGPRRDVARVYAALDVLCSSSISEAFPLVIGEAMACGVPCVVTDAGDSALLVGPTGTVVPPRDPTAMAAALAAVLSKSPAERCQLGIAARQRVRDRFALDDVARRYESLYEQLAGAARRPPAADPQPSAGPLGRTVYV